ncbi:protein NLRC5 isoform X2 [Trichosurus vulpecula]|uniref:protein NLRC5 isoform X2 n=1 Tax=Trichosurus vulpecula TaxID=9337 RepID=UPI00186B3124|nr:protein NLRC5 isoform X2 [Trichosurus vulpecula]
MYDESAHPTNRCWIQMDSLSFPDDVESLKRHLVGLLSENLEWLTSKAKFFLPDLDLIPVDETPDPTQKVFLLLSKLEAHGSSTWRTFIDCVCMEHIMPLHLETMLLSVWGIDSEFPKEIRYFCEDALPKSQLLHSGLKQSSSEIGSSPRRKRSRQQQLESVRRYEKLLRTLLLQRYGSTHVRTTMPQQGRPFSFSQTYVDLVVHRSKVTWLKENPEKPQGDALSEPLEAEDGTNLKVQDLFKGQSGAGTKVTVLLGKPGAGKSMLMHRICQKWANGELGQFSQVFLFEFRQLNLVKQELTLSQLLFELYLSPEDERDAIFQHLQENAHRVLLVFDGLDEFLHPWSSRGSCVEDSLDPTLPLPVTTLFSSLCSGSLLPGCWVVTTSRPGKIPDFLLETATSVFEVWGFNGLQIEKYVSNFFHGLTFQDIALNQLRDNTQLLSLCSVPALCCIICICLYHLLLQGSTINFPSTVTQVYMQMLHVFISRKQGTSEDKGTWLSKYSQALLGLGEIALEGLNAKQIVFYPGKIPERVVAFAATHNLLASFRVKTGIQQQTTCYAFVHLSLQEFFAALYLMGSPNVDEAKLCDHFFLKSKWPLRTEAKTELMDRFHTFLSGLSSQTCQSFLSQLSQQDEAWVGTKQVAIRQVLQNLAGRSLTGPKIIELCHCVGETQDTELVKQAGGHFPLSLDFHNFPLNYTDLAALTSLINHAPVPMHLDFSGCSLEPHCLDALAGCKKIESLRVRSRKCRDAFAEALSRTLPTMGNLKKLELTGNNITVRGIGHLTQAFTDCLQLEEINLQDNRLNDPSCLKIIEILHKVQRLQKIDLSRNAVSDLTILALAKEAVSYPKVTTLEIRQAQITILFFVSSKKALEMPRSQNVKKNEPPEKVMIQARKLTFRLQKCNLAVHHAKEIAEMLKHRPYLEEVDLSGNRLGDEGCRELAETLPDLQIAKQFNISDNGLSEYGVYRLLTSANACKNVVELDVSLKNKTAILRFAGDQEEKDQAQPRATASNTQLSKDSPELPSPSARVIRLRHCGFQARDLEKLCPELGICSHLDLSNNHLGNKGIEKLTRLLPDLRSLQFLTLNENRASMKAVFYLASTFSDLEWIHEVDISLGRQQSIHLRCIGRASEQSTSGQWAKQKTQQDAHFPRSFCLRECQMDPQNLEKLLQILKTCQKPLEIKFSHVTMSDQSIEMLRDHLPQLHNLSLLQLSQTTLSLNSVFLLAGAISLCEQIRKVEVRSQKYACLYFTPGKRKGVSCGLIGCCISPVNMEQLCRTLRQCKDLSHLDLSGNLLGDEGLRYLLEHLPQMNLSGSLNLSHNGISQEGALHFIIALSTCRQAHEVSLSLDPEQKILIQFSEHQEPRKTLRLTRFNLQPEHIAKLDTLGEQVPKLTDLILANNTVSLRGLQLLLSLVRLPSGILRISVEEPWVTKASVTTLLEASVQASGNIIRINISRQQSLLHIEETFSQQTENPAVTTFRLAQCDLGASQTFPYRLIQYDLGASQIFPYRLIQCDPGASQTFIFRQVVEKCLRLQELSWSEVHLCDTSAQLLQTLLLSLPELKKLRLTAIVVSPVGVYQVASGLSCCNTVEELDLSKNEFSVEDTRVLMGALEGKCQLRSLNLSSLKLDDQTLSELAQRLQRMSLLQRLDLSNSGLSSVSCSYLSDALRGATNLEDLNLSHNKIEDAGVQYLSAILPTLLQLRKIDLSWNGISPAGGRRLAEALALCVQVEELHLGANTMGDMMAIRLAQNLPHHLKVLYLCSNQIGIEGTLSLGQALARCQWIEEISLAENIFAEGILPLSEGLLKLRKINLTSCKINDQMTKPLASSLILCHELEEILLAWNSLGNEGASELAHVLPQMNQLKKLDLEGNQIGSLGAQLLAKGLARGLGIQVICLWKNPVPKDTAQLLQGQDPRLNFS